MMTSDPPPGFVPVGGLCGRFIEHSGPLFGRLEGQDLRLGFRVLDRHTNPLACAHGGMLASLADMVLACGVMYRPEGWGRVLPTVSLQLDFLSFARLGAWVEGNSETLRTTSSLIFAQAVILADGAPALRASGIFKRAPAAESESNWDPLQLRGSAPRRPVS